MPAFIDHRSLDPFTLRPFVKRMGGHVIPQSLKRTQRVVYVDEYVDHRFGRFYDPSVPRYVRAKNGEFKGWIKPDNGKRVNAEMTLVNEFLSIYPKFGGRDKEAMLTRWATRLSGQNIRVEMGLRGIQHKVKMSALHSAVLSLWYHRTCPLERGWRPREVVLDAAESCEIDKHHAFLDQSVILLDNVDQLGVGHYKAFMCSKEQILLDIPTRMLVYGRGRGALVMMPLDDQFPCHQDLCGLIIKLD